MRHPIYERLGVRPVINAVGTLTRIGGSLMAPEVVQSIVVTPHQWALDNLVL
jgi:seryl-tRNA(Sec) selenium transferase